MLQNYYLKLAFIYLKLFGEFSDVKTYYKLNKLNIPDI